MSRNIDRTLQIRYSPVYKQNLLDSFLRKFEEDKKPFKKKLQEIGIAKGTFSSLINARTLPSKRTMEKMRAYLEARKPIFHNLNPQSHFFCSGCETILSVEVRHHKDRWYCRPCISTQKGSSKMNLSNPTEEKYSIQSLFAGLNKKYLEQKKVRTAKKQYGSFGPAFRLLLMLKKEVRKYDKAINGSDGRHVMGNDSKTEVRKSKTPRG